jgi:hypothetical protein
MGRRRYQTKNRRLVPGTFVAKVKLNILRECFSTQEEFEAWLETIPPGYVGYISNAGEAKFRPAKPGREQAIIKAYSKKAK